MKAIKIVLKTLVSLIIGLIIGIFAIQMWGMYKPVFQACRRIDEVKEYAMPMSDATINDDSSNDNTNNANANNDNTAVISNILVNKDVKIIGLGEATHGNKEFQELKLDVLKNVVANNKVSALAFEMDYAEGTLINDYICGKTEMTIEELFSHISFELYHTEEIKELIEWMKDYNANSPENMLEFYGYDIQNPEVGIFVIQDFIRKNKINLTSDTMDAFLANEFDFKDEKMFQALDDLKEYKEELSKQEYQNYDNIDRILKCIDNIFLSNELASIPLDDSIAYGTYRDQAMKNLVMDIANTLGRPIMITGHNGHVGYAGSYVKTMGAYLKEELGDDYFVIGTDYFRTKDSIKSAKGRKNHVFYSGDRLAYQAKDLGTYYLRFADVEENETLNNIIHKKMSTGSLGESYSILNKLMPGSIRVYAPVADLYDGMIFVYKATPFTQLGY